MANFYKQLVGLKRDRVIAAYNKLMKGNISVSQAHAQRDEIYIIFSQLADELAEANEERIKAQRELARTQMQMKHLTNN